MSHSNEPEAVASACLGGVHCRYDGKSKPDAAIMENVQKNRICLACPECMAGLKSPRPPAEIQGGDGFDVLDGRAKVVDSEGRDVTEEFIRGSERFVDFVRRSGAQRVYLKSGSPSCGVHKICDGSFSGRKRDGCGVAAALLARNGIDVTEV